MEEIKEFLHNVWVKVMLKCKVLLPYGIEGGVRFNVNNPFGYIVLLITMVLNWLGSILFAIFVSVCEGFYALIAVYIRTIQKGFEMQANERLQAAKDFLKKNMVEKGHTTLPPTISITRKPAPKINRK